MSRQKNPCSNRGSRHIKRARDMGQAIKLGLQKCPTCGADIVVQKRGDWAFTPMHNKGESPLDMDLQESGL